MAKGMLTAHTMKSITARVIMKVLVTVDWICFFCLPLNTSMMRILPGTPIAINTIIQTVQTMNSDKSLIHVSITEEVVFNADVVELRSMLFLIVFSYQCENFVLGKL